ncbi:MAG: RIP metalloprotease RseP [Burkholderiaceae bacterium]|nr:RIP metalloprotease RseP [Burkholderiaceae bacterium]
MLTTILAFIVALGIIITFHEYGHYWAARRCGVKVLRFSVGFGKPLFKRVDKTGTEWVVAGIPLGGYVKMQDEPEPGASEEQKKQAFSQQPVKNRFFIVSAGPIANFILAAVLYAALNLIGTEEPAPILAQPSVGTPAAQAGIAAGDRVTAVNGQPVQSWNQARWLMLDDMIHGGVVMLSIDRFGRQSDLQVALPGAGSEPDTDALAKAGLELQPGKTVITSVQPDGAGHRAGLMDGDVVQLINGQPVRNVLELIQTVQANPDRSLNMVVERQSAQISLEITPAAAQGQDGTIVGRIGVGLANEMPMVTVEHGLVQSVWQGVTRTFETAWFSLKMLGSMITGAVSWKNISGPVTIADYAGQTAQIGLTAYLAFLALVSVSIGVLNLLPIPMLDGGHLMYYTVEMVRGKPTPEHWMAAGQKIGLVLLAGLMTLAIFNDVTRLLG